MGENSDVDYLLKKIKSKKLKSEYFDDFVHQLASIRASKINNGGIEVQINFLLDNGWDINNVEGVLP